jgi:hypothetical protein
MLQQTILRKLPEVPDRNVQSVVNWHYNHDFNAIAPDEQSYLSHTGDLFSLVQKSVSPIRHLVNSSERLRTLSLWRYQKEDAPEYDTKQVLYYSDKRIDAFDSAFIFFLGAAMLVAPIWILQTLDVLQAKLGVITAFIVLFLAMMSYAIHTKPFEALGATAA